MTKDPFTKSYDEDVSKNKNKDLASLTHITGLLISVIGPATIYATSDDDFVKENARRALNWQISMIIYSFISFLLIFFVIGVFLVMILPFFNITFSILAALKAKEGKVWNYPYNLDIVNNSTKSRSNQNDYSEYHDYDTSYNKNRNRKNNKVSPTENIKDKDRRLFEQYIEGEISKEEYEKRRRFDKSNQKKRRDLEYN